MLSLGGYHCPSLADLLRLMGKQTRMAIKGPLGSDPTKFRKQLRAGTTVRSYGNNEIVFSQGDRADDIFYILSGTVKLTAVSTNRKKAIIAFLQQGSFFGEGCLGGQSLRICTARSIGHSSITRHEKGQHGSHAQARPAVRNTIC